MVEPAGNTDGLRGPAPSEALEIRGWWICCSLLPLVMVVQPEASLIWMRFLGPLMGFRREVWGIAGDSGEEEIGNSGTQSSRYLAEQQKSRDQKLGLIVGC